MSDRNTELAQKCEFDSGIILNRLKSLYPKSIDLTLNRPQRLLAALDHPERRLPPVIHFAGTNGKGSTLAMVRAGLEAAGQSVHAYISPHLAHFNERITLSGKLIREESLIQVLLECEGVNKGKPISLFEITTAAAMLAFSRCYADHLLLEVGLGGRLDATNVIETPILTVITPISMDHEQYLGTTLSSIATEKAGILKPGVPCIVGHQEPLALKVIEAQAANLNCPLFVENRDWSASIVDDHLLYRDVEDELYLPKPILVGTHQTGNAGSALAVLRKIGLNKMALEAAMTTARWPGRMQRLLNGPLVDAAQGNEIWLDGGHNPAAGIALADTLRCMPRKATQIICGMLDTKDAHGFLRALRNAADKLYAIAIPEEKASLPAAHVATAAREVGFWSDASSSPEMAVQAISADHRDTRILVCGSLYLAGQILRENN